MTRMAAVSQASSLEAPLDIALARGHLYALRTATPDIFAVAGSFRVATAFDRGETSLLALTAAVAAQGSRRYTRSEWAHRFERRGAHLWIEPSADRVSFFARACSEDLPLVVESLIECLREPRLDAEDFEVERARAIAESHSCAADPADMASAALSRAIHPPAHPRYRAESAETIATLEATTHDDVRRYHRERFEPNDLRIVVVGDIDPFEAATAFDRSLATWPTPAVSTTVSPTPLSSVRASASLRETAAEATPETTTIRLDAPGSETVEVALGHGLALRCGDPDVLPLWLANRILGVGFGSRLVAAVREERGLTYAIHSNVTPPLREFDAHWSIGVSLSPERLEAGLAATRAEIERFVEAGIDAHTLEIKRRQAIGAFRIELATLAGLSEAMLYGAERGWGADYPLALPRLLDEIDVVRLNRAVRAYFRPDALHTAIAGPLASI